MARGLRKKVPMASGVSPIPASPAMVTVTGGCCSSEPWIPIKEKQAQDMWTPKEPEPLAQHLHDPQLRSHERQPTPKAFHASPFMQHVAQDRQFTDVSIVPSLLLGVASLLLVFLLPLLAPEQATWVVGPRPQTGLLQPAVLLLERLFFVQRPRLENDEMCGLTTGGQVSVRLLWLPDSVASRF